ncbi:uncharacterized protein PFLUO_LOCUS6196 [Penicillium psychrofluorescens]|uniref:uncharacterized protein n=1 Tax=Penicillium psychrofluorescens TaxID=3158075 RepID=UPI003CCE4F93
MDDLRVYILTYNCARNLIDLDLFAQHFFDTLTDAPNFPAPELIVLSLQEVAPIAYAFLGGSYLIPYFNAFCQAVKKATAKQWGENYVNLVRDHTGMTGLMVFARSDVSDKISWIETAHVGFGVQEMGNKGAVGARMGYAAEGRPSETLDLTFVAAHLAPMEDGLEQRNLDWQSIVERLVFSQQHEGAQSDEADENTALLRGHERRPSDSRRQDIFAPNAYLFLAGDLNYRTSSIKPLKGDTIRFPRRTAEPSSPSHYSHLLEEDQLLREMHQGRSFHGMCEAPIDFPPTYKYSDAARDAARKGADGVEGDDQEWLWASHRWPSWCDRILYLDGPSWAGAAGRVKTHAYNALPLLPQSDHRGVALALSVPVNPVPDIDHMPSDAKVVAPFSIDPNWRHRRDVARRKEIAVGLVAYLGLTWEGNGMLLASTLSLFGAWYILRTFLEG